jgi:hypothetical protein
LQPYFLPNNSVLTFIDRVASLLIKNVKISYIYFSHGDTTQNGHDMLLTERCSFLVGGLCILSSD